MKFSTRTPEQELIHFWFFLQYSRKIRNASGATYLHIGIFIFVWTFINVMAVFDIYLHFTWNILNIFVFHTLHYLQMEWKITTTHSYTHINLFAGKHFHFGTNEHRNWKREINSTEAIVLIVGGFSTEWQQNGSKLLQRKKNKQRMDTLGSVGHWSSSFTWVCHRGKDKNTMPGAFLISLRWSWFSKRNMNNSYRLHIYVTRECDLWRELESTSFSLKLIFNNENNLNYRHESGIYTISHTHNYAIHAALAITVNGGGDGDLLRPK